MIKKFGEDSSGNLAVLITYYLFFSIFPLLLALFSILGFLLHGHPSWKTSIENGALKNFQSLPLIQGPLPDDGSVVVVVLGSVLALYSGLGVAKTAQTVWDTVYRVPKSDQPGFVPKNLRALRLVIVGGLGLIATTVVSANIASAGALGLHLSHYVSIIGYVVTLVLNALLFTLIFRWLTVREVSFRDALPGAVVSAAALVILQIVVPLFISHKLAKAKRQYGEAGAVLVILSWFYLQSQFLLLAAQINVVRQDHLWPRSLSEPATETTALGEAAPDVEPEPVVAGTVAGGRPGWGRRAGLAAALAFGAFRLGRSSRRDDDPA